MDTNNKRKGLKAYAMGGDITGDTIVSKKVQTPILASTLTPAQQAYKEKRDAQKAKNALRLAPLEAARSKRISDSGLSEEEYNKREKVNSGGHIEVSNLDTNTANQRGKDKGSCTTGTKNKGESLVDVKRNGGIIGKVPKLATGGMAVASGAISGASAGAIGGPPGMAAGAAIGTVTSSLAAIEAEKLRLRNLTVEKQNIFDSNTREQNIYSNQFKNDNINDLPTYANGGEVNKTIKPSTTGKFDTVGGDLVPISDNAEVVVGNKHSEKKVDGSYGVTLSEDGAPVANVEDEEVVVDNKLVFSDKLKKGNETFASIALKVNKSIGDLQEKKEYAKSTAEKFSLDRTIEGLENKNSNLFKEQELVKQNTVGDKEEVVAVENGVVNKGENGLNLFNKPKFNSSSTVEMGDPRAYIGEDEDENGLSKYKDLAPMLIDNVTNYMLTKNAPKPSAPIVRRSPILDTTVNINPMLANIKNSISSGNKVLADNTNSSAVARANITSNNLRGMEASTNAMADKEAKEIQLKNTQNKVLADTANTNAELNDQHQWDVYQNKLEKNASYSENVSNLVQDYTAVKKNINTDERENSILELNALRDPTGQTARDFGKTKAIMAARKQRLLRK